MSLQAAFQQIVSEIYAISPYLTFKLPGNIRSVNQQVKQLLLVEQRLHLIKENTICLFGMSGNPVAQQAYQTLIDLLEQMRLAAIHLQLLTEEHLVDPEGTQICFQTEVVKYSSLLSQIKSLKAIDLAQKSVVRL